MNRDVIVGSRLNLLDSYQEQIFSTTVSFGDISIFWNTGPNVTFRWAAFSPTLIAAESLGNLVRAQLTNEPLERGMYHPSQSMFESIMYLAGRNAGICLQTILRDPANTNVLPDMLELLGRIRSDNFADLGVEVVAEFLSDKRVTVRDGTVKALEGWATPRAIALLQNHASAEGNRAIKDYMLQVIEDFQIHESLQSNVFELYKLKLPLRDSRHSLTVLYANPLPCA